jgi:hypothetical protein
VIDYSFRKYKRSVAKNPLNFSKEIKKKQGEGITHKSHQRKMPNKNENKGDHWIMEEVLFSLL